MATNRTGRFDDGGAFDTNEQALAMFDLMEWERGEVIRAEAERIELDNLFRGVADNELPN